MRRNGRLRPEEPAVIDRRREGAVVADAVEWGTLRALVDPLSSDQQRVVILRYCGGLDATEMGRALGKSADAVRHLEYRALATIRDGLATPGRAA
jgi:DNA-directed RNA polymerase specialized sigma24 family protein